MYDETVIAKSLEQVQKSVGPGVSLGSYPVSNQPDNAQLLITLDSKQPELLREASAQVRGDTHTHTHTHTHDHGCTVLHFQWTYACQCFAGLHEFTYMCMCVFVCVCVCVCVCRCACFSL